MQDKPRFKRYFHGFAMCQSMFCALPCPWSVWDESARPLMLLFLPVVGLEIGAIWAAAAYLLTCLCLPSLSVLSQSVSSLSILRFPVPPLLAAALLTACPFWLTGSIHLDGFMDVTDAVRSFRSLDKRREILKDPRVGTFAVIGCVFVFLLQFSCLASVTLRWLSGFASADMQQLGKLAAADLQSFPNLVSVGLQPFSKCVSANLRSFSNYACVDLQSFLNLTDADLKLLWSSGFAGNGKWVLLFIPVVSRCLSVAAVTLLPPMPASQYAEQKKEPVVVMAAGIFLAASLAAGFLLCGRLGWCLVGVMAGYGAALSRAFHSLRGMNGDIAGYALTIGELCGLVALALLTVHA